jgi:microcystin-dependent protein
MKSIFYIIIIFILIGMLYYNQSCKDISESMANTEETKIFESIKRIYGIDSLSIRSLSDIATKMQTSGISINGSLYVTGNLNVVGDFILSGPTNLVPKGVIVAWNSSTAPYGWAICDGTNDTPDLRGKFILGAGQKLLNTSGGTETTMLSINNIPTHNHKPSTSSSTAKLLREQSKSCLYKDDEDSGKKTVYEAGVGWSGNNTPYVPSTLQQEFKDAYATTIKDYTTQQPISIMPPYYVLTYIIKI